MKKERGNIILTALFVAVFLFFLSIALIWTNRQDLALSLTMEHKVKAEAAARSGAMNVYGALRSFGRPPASQEGQLISGARWKVELVELPPEPKRGPMLLVRSRGTSGPLSAYYTLHLQKTELASPIEGSNSGPGRMLGFLQEQGANVAASGSSEGEASSEGGGTSQPSGKALYGDFELKEVDIKLESTDSYAANQGPLFFSSMEEIQLPPLYVIAYIPVLYPTGATPKGYGPVLISAPKTLSRNVIRVMGYKDEEFSWTEIPPPLEPDPDLEMGSTPPVAALEMEAQGAWTTANARTLLDVGSSFSWRDELPATDSESEALDLVLGKSFEISMSGLLDWASVPVPKPIRTYTMRGAIAAHKDTVYSHAYEYLYAHYQAGTPPVPVPAIEGSTITRWPCVRAYSMEDKAWSTPWSALKDNASVEDDEVPDPNVLRVDSQGTLYSRTTEAPFHLLTLEPGGGVTRGQELPGEGDFFIYQDAPHVVSPDPTKPGLLNLKSNKLIDFSSLPDLIPEISGPVITSMPNEINDPGLAPLEVSAVGETTAPVAEPRTVRQAYELDYRIAPDTDIISDGRDLYAVVGITASKQEPTYELMGTFDLGAGEGEVKVLARYDGERWHILPNGLMAALTQGLSAPGDKMFCARYDGLPEDVPRYSVISTSVDPFEMNAP